MTKTILYKYIGYNGAIVSPVQLNCNEKLNLICLTADEGKCLTNGDKIVYSITVPEHEASEWSEVEAIGQE